MRKSSAYVAAACAFAFLAACSTYLLVFRSMMIANSDRRVAVYAHLRFQGYPDFAILSVPDEARAELYVELPDKKRYLLREIPESALEQVCEKTDRRLDPNFPENIVAYSLGKTILEYRDGKLLEASFVRPASAFKFSSRQDGDYLTMPFSKDDLIRVFGEPLRWERPGPSRPPE